MVVVVLVIGILAALALVHFLTPCEGAALCMSAVITPTRSDTWLRRLLRPFRRWSVRWRLADTEAAIDYVEADIAELPEIRMQLRREANALRVRLAVLQPTQKG